MTAKMLRDLIDSVGLDDPHEFATWFVNHVEDARRTGQQPLTVTAGVQRFLATV